MNSVDDFPPTGYQDDDNERVVHTSTSEQAVVHKKGSKLPFIIFVVLLVVALAVVAMMFLGGQKQPAKAPAPTPTEAPVDPTAVDPNTDPTAVDPNAVDPNAVDPNAVDPNADPFAATTSDPTALTPQIDPATGLPVAQPMIDPNTGLPMAQQPAVAPQQIDPTTGLPVVQPSPQAVEAAQPMVQQQIDPTTGLPVAQPIAVVQQPLAQQPVAPQQPTADPFANMNQAPTQPAVQQPAVQQPAVQQPALQQPAVQQPAVQQPATEQPADAAPVAEEFDPLAQFRTLLAPIDSRVSVLEKKFSGLEKTVKKLQSLIGGESRSSHSTSSSRRSGNSIKTIDTATSSSIRVAPPVSRVIIEDGRVARVERPTDTRWEANQVAYVQPSYTAPSQCDIQAIVQGRVWIKRPDGSFMSYGEGDAWNNGAIIRAIDPQRGVNVDGRWICM